MIHLVRHAHAGKRAHWEGPDRLRPLSERGILEAKLIARDLADLPVPRVLTSPYLRCVQTVAPLAEATGSAPEPEAALAEGAAPEDLLRLVAGLEPHTVLCSHGDVIGSLIGHLAARGVPMPAEPGWPKASTWRLSVTAGRVTAARFVPPPDV